MLDAFGPAVDAFRAGVRGGRGLAEAASAAARAAEDGAHATIQMVATRGRASYLAEKSAGHQDPGATSTLLLFRALSDTVRD
jgi:dihydroxyacetone kinase-like protein